MRGILELVGDLQPPVWRAQRHLEGKFVQDLIAAADGLPTRALSCYISAMHSTNRGPLAGMRILDLTSVVLGPLATQILGDWGAEVLKVESPAGDLMRSNGVLLNPGMSSIFLALNRNKRSLCLDLATAAGAAVLARLIPTADVFVHNMRIAAIERLGFGQAAVTALNPRIVYCAATGFDQDGPDRDKPAFDDIIQAASGLVAIASLGRAEPSYVPTLVADKTAGLAVANAILAALLHRERTGEGQCLEVPMLETFTAFVLAEHLAGLTFDQSTVPAGYGRLVLREAGYADEQIEALLQQGTVVQHLGERKSLVDAHP